MREVRVEVSLARQTLLWRGAAGQQLCYPVSTAANGPGCELGSFCTPLGLHRIRLKLGGDCPAGSVFAARRPTGEIFSEALRRTHPGRDWILSRLLWLEGLEPGRNRGGRVDSLRRFIYIHGTSDEDRIGTPASHGCIRMKNADVIDLFERVERGTRVEIAL
jgi:L,D-transpeptidase YbiS